MGAVLHLQHSVLSVNLGRIHFRGLPQADAAHEGTKTALINLLRQGKLPLALFLFTGNVPKEFLQEPGIPFTDGLDVLSHREKDLQKLIGRPSVIVEQRHQDFPIRVACRVVLDPVGALADFIVDSLLSQGLHILAGSPKVGVLAGPVAGGDRGQGRPCLGHGRKTRRCSLPLS